MAPLVAKPRRRTPHPPGPVWTAAPGPRPNAPRMLDCSPRPACTPSARSIAGPMRNDLPQQQQARRGRVAKHFPQKARTVYISTSSSTYIITAPSPSNPKVTQSRIPIPRAWHSPCVAVAASSPVCPPALRCSGRPANELFGLVCAEPTDGGRRERWYGRGTRVSDDLRNPGHCVRHRHRVRDPLPPSRHNDGEAPHAPSWSIWLTSSRFHGLAVKLARL